MLILKPEDIKYDLNNQFMELFKKMAMGPTHFKYQTVSGETRCAYGTVNVDALPEELLLKADANDLSYFSLDNPVNLFEEKNMDVYFIYFDIEKNGIRQFMPSRVLD